MSEANYASIINRLEELCHKNIPGILTPVEAAILLDAIDQMHRLIRELQLNKGF